jgi:uncharacterized membrane protein required for colicin V production
VLIGGLILAQLYMHDVGEYLVEHAKASRENAPMYGFLCIYLGLFLVQGLFYRIVTKNYKIGGIADRIGGIILGFMEGILFVSSLLFIFEMSGFPDNQNKRDSQFYKSVINIAPQILDFTSTVGTDSFEKFKEMGTAPAAEGGGKVKGVHHQVDSAAEANRRR